jgi:tripartite-type tricarboxylate transporter receptor subunit TctC
MENRYSVVRRSWKFHHQLIQAHIMKLPRRQFLHLAAGAAALPVVSRVARAQAYPTRPVRLIVGFPPGGSFDIVARLTGQWLSSRLGQPIIVENRSGAGGGNIATEAVVNAPPDGYTLLIINDINAVNATLYDKLNFNFVRDITPVASIARVPNVLEVNPSVPARTVPELIAYAKANPGKLNMASGGNGSPGHVSGELFKMMAGISMVHVPYRGGAPALADMLGGQVQVMVSNIPQTIGYIKAGKLRPLAVTTAERLDALPGIPTVGEFVPGYETSGWIGVGAPRSTSREIIEKLNREINAGLNDPKMKERLTDLGLTVFENSSADFGKYIVGETEKWAKVIRAANIKVE